MKILKRNYEQLVTLAQVRSTNDAALKWWQISKPDIDNVYLCLRYIHHAGIYFQHLGVYAGIPVARLLGRNRIRRQTEIQKRGRNGVSQSEPPSMCLG